MLTDEQWAAFDPLIEACRPPAKVAPQNLRQTISAILWRHQNGTKWRAVPEALGPWWEAAQTFIRWSRLGGVGAATDPGTGEPGETGHDLPRRDQHPCSSQGSRCSSKEETAEQRDEREALGRSRRGFGTKACVFTDASGRAVAFVLAPGEDHELPHAIPLLEKLPSVPKWVVADRAYGCIITKLNR